MLCAEVGRRNDFVNLVVCTTTVRLHRVNIPYVFARCCLDEVSFVPVYLRLLFPAIYKNVFNTALCNVLFSVYLCRPWEKCFYRYNFCSAYVRQCKRVVGAAFPSLQFDLCLSPRSCDWGRSSHFQTLLCVVRIGDIGSIARDIVK